MIKKSLFLLLASFFFTFFAAANFIDPTYSANLPEYQPTANQPGGFCNFTPSGSPTGNIDIANPCVVYENANGVANGNLTLGSSATLTLHHDLVWYPGYKITVSPGAVIFVNSDSKMVQGKICILDADGDGYADPVKVTTDPQTGQIVDTGTSVLTQIDSKVVTTAPYNCPANYVPRENFTTLAYVDTGTNTAGVNFATGDNIFLSMGFMMNGVTDVNAAAGDIQVPADKNFIMLPGGTGGKIGVGTTVPQNKITVSGGTTKATGIGIRSADVWTTIYNMNGGNQAVIDVTAGGTETTIGPTAYGLIVNPSGGGVGIGMAPVQTLDVNGTMRTNNYLYINKSDPTIYMQDTDGRSAMIHTNSNQFYVLRGSGNNATTWTQYNGYWPLQIDLETNNVQLGGNLAIPGNLSVTGTLNGASTSLYHVDNVAGDHNIASGNNNSSYPYAALEVREYGFAGAQTGAASEAPRISFHWSGRVAAQIGIDTASVIRTYDNPGTGYNAFAAGPITANGDIHGTGDLILDGNYGEGLVGLYSATRYQNVFAMGAAYRLTSDGTGPGNLYGIAWTHQNIGGQSKTGLLHQALFMNNGVTQTAIGTGIWTNGAITIAGTGLNNSRGSEILETDASDYLRINQANSYTNGTAAYGNWEFGSGNVAMGTWTPEATYKLKVVGSFYAGGSSRDYKTNIVPLQLDSSKIYQLNAVSYDYKDQYKSFGKKLAGGRQFGLIAEDVYKVYPELTLSLDDKMIANVDYEKLGVLLLEEIKKHKKDIDDLKAKNAELEQRLQIVEQKLNSLIK